MRRALTIGGLAVVVLALAGVVAVAGQNGIAKPERIVVVERAITDLVIDSDQSGGDSSGDLLTFHNPVFDDDNEHRVGRDQGDCIRIDPVGGTWECRWITWIDGRGSITVEGPFFDASDSVLAVTGGTGGFRNVRGQMRLHARSATVFAFVFLLEP